LTRLVSERPAGTVAIVDGTFHSYPAVGHAEILQAIRRGWHIWGLSSMGAIRAAEMASLGMRGYGSVYHRFATDPQFSDDEVTLIHGTDAPYLPLSEPLVHMRTFIGHLVANEALKKQHAELIVDFMKMRWYGFRTLDLLASQLSCYMQDHERIAKEITGFQRFRIKSLDLENFLIDTPWAMTDDTVESAGPAVS